MFERPSAYRRKPVAKEVKSVGKGSDRSRSSLLAVKVICEKNPRIAIFRKPARAIALAIILAYVFGGMPVLGAHDQLSLVAASSNNFPPVNLLDEQDNLTGFGRELAQAVTHAMGAEVTQIHSGNWTEVLGWLDSGRADFIHDTGYTPERTEYLDFSEPILEMPEGIFVLDHRYDIQSLSSLYGKRVACVNKHITHFYLMKFPDINCHIVATPVEGVRALLDETVDAFIYPRQIVLYYAYQLDVAKRIKEIGEPLRTLTWHMTVKKGNSKVLLLLNQGIAKVRNRGEYDRIYQKWFGYIAAPGYTALQVARIVGFVVLFASLLVGVVAVWNWMLRRVVARRTAALRESEASLATAQRIAMLGNWRCDTTGQNIVCSKEIYHMLGAEPGALAGCDSLLALVVPEDRQSVEETLQICLKSGSPGQCEFRMEANDGRKKVMLLQVERESGAAPYIHGIIQDITDRKKIEDEIRELNEELEARVDARTNELEETHKQLITQERMAALGKLTGVMAHELRNPLGTIQSSLEVIRWKSADAMGEELKKPIDRMGRNITRCERIISELLDYSRAEVVDKRETILDDWLARVLEDIERPADIALKSVFGAPGASVGVDRSQIRRVLINVIDNACQAMRAETESGSDKRHAITVTTGVRDGKVCLEIADNGPGISREIQSRIFEPLFSTKPFGVGLGLPIIQQIVEQHDGTLHLNSQQNEGVTVSIEFRLNSENEEIPAV